MPRAWIDVLPELAQGRPSPERIRLIGCDWVQSFLQRHRVDAEAVEASEAATGGTVFMPASAVATPVAARAVSERLSGRARVVLCGRPTLGSWLLTPGLFGPDDRGRAAPAIPRPTPPAWLGTCAKLATGRLFSVRPYLTASADLSFFALRSGAERHAVLEATELELRKAGLTGRSLAAQVEATEELMLRALGAAADAMKIDAPSSEERLDETTLPFGCEIRLSVGVDDRYIAVGASDLYSHVLTTRESVAEAVRTVFTGRRIDPSQGHRPRQGGQVRPITSSSTSHRVAFAR